MKFLYDNSLINNKIIEQHTKTLQPYLERLRVIADSKDYTEPESSINLVFNTEMHNHVQRIANEKTNAHLKYIIIVGIGGSNLGTKALYDAFFGFFDQFEPRRFPKMIFIETTDPEKLMMLRAFLGDVIKNPDEIIINVISKSGKTLETIANAEFVIHAVREYFHEIDERIVVTTDQNSALWNAAQEKKLTCLPIPVSVGGRYSVFSAVGLFPFYAMGMNVRDLLRGAQSMRETCLKKTMKKNPALAAASILFSHYKPGITHDLFLFHPELESLGKWYRQLLAESIGKEKNIHGEIIHSGISPRVSIGSTDLHAIGQLNLGGPKTSITTFVSVEKQNTDPDIPSHTYFENLIPNIEKLTMTKIMNAILDGTKKSYVTEKMPFMEVKLTDLSLGSLGEFMQWSMMTIMMLGNVMQINAFDQPNVESYKQETRKILRLE